MKTIGAEREYDDYDEYRREELPDCPTCGYAFPLDTFIVFDPDTGEILEWELFCMECQSRWTSQTDQDTVQPQLRRWA